MTLLIHPTIPGVQQEVPETRLLEWLDAGWQLPVLEPVIEPNPEEEATRG